MGPVKNGKEAKRRGRGRVQSKERVTLALRFKVENLKGEGTTRKNATLPETT